MRIRRATYSSFAGVAVLAALAGAGCGSSEQGRPRGDAALTVYSSLPHSGVSARAADAVAAGARLALADAHGRAAGRAVRLVELDSAAPGGEAWDPAAVEANARRAADDPTAIAYLGELDLGASAVSVPVTSASGLLQVAPGDGLTTLTRRDPAEPEELPARYYPHGTRTFARVVPTDSDQARALVAWVRSRGVRRLAIVRDDRLFGRELAAEAELAARALHVAVTGVEEARRRAPDYADVARDVAERRPRAVLYTGLGDRDGDRVLAALRRALPAVPLYGTSALAAAPGGPSAPPADVLQAAAPPASYPRAARRVLRRLESRAGAPVASEALLGYAAMRAVLDAVAAAGSRAADRAAVVRAALGPRPGRASGGPVPAPGASAPAPGPPGARAAAAVPPRPLLGDRFAAYRRAGGRLRFLGLRSP
jgi:ABC-type branched-subunit amino acid transport system substrate-binding protein